MVEKIKNIILQAPLNKEFEVIEIEQEQNGNITIYIDSLSGISIDDCVIVSKYIQKNIPETENINLTVSSGGIDKPLRAPIQFLKNIGKEVIVKLTNGKKITGTLIAYNNKLLTLSVKEKKQTIEKQIQHSDIQQVKVKLF